MMVRQKLSYRRFLSIFFFALLTLMTCACGRPFSARTANPSPTPTQVPCTAPSQRPGDSVKTIVSGGIKRDFLVHLPPSYGKYLQPLVIGYLGYSWTMQ